MKHFWVVEFLHSLGWTPYSVHLSRLEAREKVKLERRRHGDRWKIRASKAARVSDPTDAGREGK